MNNRIIKFRVWNKVEWCGKFTPQELSQTYPNPCDYGHIDDLIYQQFTGLKDKNGKEIYEGDIVKYDFGSEKNIINKIVWNHFGWRISEMDGEGCYPLTYGIDFEVIGNIFENLELLK